MAKSFLIAQISFDDPEGYKSYTSRTPAIVERFGGRFVVRGSPLHLLEGEIGFDRFVLIEFPDLESAQAFYRSPEYQESVPHRTANSRGTLFLAEGMDG